MRGLLTVRRAGLVAVVAAVAAFGVAIAGCGSSAKNATSTGGSAKAKPQTVTIAVSADTEVFAQPFIAQALGYFKQAGVNVKLLDNTGSNTLNYIASGQADLGMIAAGSPLLMAAQGKDSQIIYSPQSGAAGGMLVGGPGVTSIEALKGKRIGTLAPGSSMYGYGVVYDNKFGLNADIVPFQTVSSLAGAVASGQVMAGTGPWAAYSALLSKGRAHILIDTRQSAGRHKVLGPDYPEGAVFGIASNLKSKSGAIVKVLTGFNQALRYIRKSTPQQIADTLHTQSGFQATPAAELTGDVKNSLGYIGIDDGAISAKTWSYALTQYAHWGLGNFDPKNPTFAYNARVNMTYLDKALG
jgi:NitT/TauT family transport system substrate-binding protein